MSKQDTSKTANRIRAAAAGAATLASAAISSSASAQNTDLRDANINPAAAVSTDTGSTEADAAEGEGRLVAEGPGESVDTPFETDTGKILEDRGTELDSLSAGESLGHKVGGKREDFNGPESLHLSMTPEAASVAYTVRARLFPGGIAEQQEVGDFVGTGVRSYTVDPSAVAPHTNEVYSIAEQASLRMQQTSHEMWGHDMDAAPAAYTTTMFAAELDEVRSISITSAPIQDRAAHIGVIAGAFMEAARVKMDAVPSLASSELPQSKETAPPVTEEEVRFFNNSSIGSISPIRSEAA